MDPNEPTFEICEHNTENPYVMISREMAQDKSISPKAKGVLLYLLSLPKNWKVYHSQLRNGLGVGEDYINSAMEELISAGYASRTRERLQGTYQPYRYKIREFKKFSPNGENRPGSSGPVNPVLHKKERENKEEEKKGLSVAGPVGPAVKNQEKKENAYSITIKEGENKERTITQSDLFLKVSQSKEKWEAKMVLDAWKALGNYSGIVYDWWRFIEGTMQNMKKKEQANAINTKPRKDTKTQNVQVSEYARQFSEPKAPIPLEELKSAASIFPPRQYQKKEDKNNG